MAKFKVACAAWMTDPDEKGLYAVALRGDVVDLADSPKVTSAAERGLLIGADDPLPEPSSPAKQREEALRAGRVAADAATSGSATNTDDKDDSARSRRRSS